MEGQDFIATELLKELKEGNQRKDAQIDHLHRLIFQIILLAGIIISAIVAGFLLYLNQYDFESTSTITKSAEGVYAIVDSEGNVLGQDLTPEELQTLMEALNNGEGEINQENNQD